MNKIIVLNNRRISYIFEYKNVKNINLRIRSDGSIFVSANKRVPEKIVVGFILSKADFILKALEKYESIPYNTLIQYFSEEEIRDVVICICKKVYPYFEKFGIKYPEIKFRKMVSRWGSCHPQKGILTFNLNLMYTPLECIEYVVLHEFTHFLQPNHSKKFYMELEKVCPDWKKCRENLKGVSLHKK